MLTTILSLPDVDREDALASLEAWAQRWGRSIQDRFVLDAQQVMVLAEPAALADLPPLISRREHPRNTRWGLVAEIRLRGTRTFAPGEFVVVYPPRDDEELERVVVLGPRRSGLDFPRARLPAARLTRFRVGKIGHPALLYLLEQDGCYYDTSTEAKLRASDCAVRLQALSDASNLDA